MLRPAATLWGPLGKRENHKDSKQCFLSKLYHSLCQHI